MCDVEKLQALTKKALRDEAAPIISEICAEIRTAVRRGDTHIKICKDKFRKFEISELVRHYFRDKELKVRDDALDPHNYLYISWSFWETHKVQSIEEKSTCAEKRKRTQDANKGKGMPLVRALLLVLLVVLLIALAVIAHMSGGEYHGTPGLWGPRTAWG